MEEASRMTLEEISKKIGISRTTIYKVLRNKDGVSEETVKMVQDALEKYHYVQNRNARNLAMNRHYTIGYVGFRSKSANYFATEVGRGLKRALQEFGDDGLTLMISEFDVEKPSEQLEAVEEMRQQGVDSFILSYSSHEVILQILERLEKENCRIVLLSRDVAEHPDNYYVGVDYYRSGMLAAELLMKLMPEGGRIFVPVTEEYKTNQDILSRLSGFQDRLKTCEKLEMLPPFFGLTGEREIKEALEKLLQEESDRKPDGIFDLTYRLDVIADVLKRQKKKIPLVGFDLFEEIRGRVEDSTIDALIYQDLSSQAYRAVRMLFEEMCYGKIRSEKKHYAKLEIIMKENLIYF